MITQLTDEKQDEIKHKTGASMSSSPIGCGLSARKEFKAEE